MTDAERALLKAAADHLIALGQRQNFADQSDTLDALVSARSAVDDGAPKDPQPIPPPAPRQP